MTKQKRVAEYAKDTHNINTVPMYELCLEAVAPWSRNADIIIIKTLKDVHFKNVTKGNMEKINLQKPMKNKTKQVCFVTLQKHGITRQRFIDTYCLY
jgi:hypothetical protein